MFTQKTRAVSPKAQFLLMFAVTLIGEIFAMANIGEVSIFFGMLGAVRDAVILTIMVTIAFGLLTAYVGSSRAAFANTALVAITTFVGESIAHLVSLGLFGEAWWATLTDAASVSLAVGACTVWLDLMERHGSGHPATWSAIRRAVGGAVFGGVFLVVAVVALAPMLTDAGKRLNDRAHARAETLSALVWTQRIQTLAISRYALSQDAAGVAYVIAESGSLNARIRDVSTRYAVEASLGAADRARLPDRQESTAAFDRSLQRAREWLEAAPRQRAAAGRALQQAVDQYSSPATITLAALDEVEQHRKRNLGEVVELQLAFNVLLALFALGILWPILRLMAAKQTQLLESLDHSKRMVSEVTAYKTALDRHAIVAVTNARGDITEANDQFVAISGYSRDELIGRNHRMLNSGTHDKAFFVKMWRQIGAGEPFQAEICNRDKNGNLYWVDTTIVPIRDANGHMEKFVSIRYDVTERQKARQALLAERALLERRVAERTLELEAAKSLAEQANAAKSNFLMTMSHELRTPLTSIISYAELIGEVANEEGRTTEADDAATIVAASHHLLSLISEVLEFSRLEARKVEVVVHPFAPEDLFGEVERAMRPIIEGNQNEFVLDIWPLGTLVTDQFRVRQCILNLLSNAAKFTREGVITLVARPMIWAGQDGVTVQVHDTGIGMSADALGRIFEPFEQVDETVVRNYGGTGLGLSITKHLMTALGGHISVQSEEGVGSTFEMWFPAVLAPLSQSDAAETLAA